MCSSSNFGRSPLVAVFLIPYSVPMSRIALVDRSDQVRFAESMPAVDEKVDAYPRKLKLNIYFRVLLLSLFNRPNIVPLINFSTLDNRKAKLS